MNILLSYVYFPRNGRAAQRLLQVLAEMHPGGYRLLIDSGAFSAANSGKIVSLDEYNAFLKKLPRDLNYRAIQLDVVNDPQASFENYLRQRDAGVNVVPVWQKGASLEQLEKLYSVTDYVMLAGGRVDRTYLLEAHKLIGDRKVHWLGNTHMRCIYEGKPWSCDSVTWLNSGRFGSVPIFSARSDFDQWWIRKDPGAVGKVADCLRDCGISIKESFDILNWKVTQISGLEGRLELHRFVGRLVWAYKANFIFRRLNTRVFLAIAGYHDLLSFILANQALLRRGVIQDDDFKQRFSRQMRHSFFRRD
jgi:hypothetical protein